LKFTVIGSRGYIGSRVTAYLAGRGDECFTPRRADPRVFSEDLGYVVYCAGLTADYRDRPFDTVRAHVSFLGDILERARFTSLVYLSSTRLYDGLGNRRVSEDDLLRLNPNDPRHLYDLSKALGESLCIHTGGGRSSVARLSCVYGAPPSARGFLPDVLLRLGRGGPVQIETSSRFCRDYVFVDDVVRGIVEIVTRGKEPIYNLASGENVTNGDLFAFLEKRTGVFVRAVSEEPGAALPIIDVSRFEQAFGFRPRSVFDGLEELLRRIPSPAEVKS